jgi:branched-chain amino acid transport system substrate-binding protein
LNTNKVPQLFVATGATRWGDPDHFPWTIGFNPSYELEGSTYGKYIASHQPDAKIAVLYQNDDYGKDMLRGLKQGLGDKAKNVIAEVTYEVSDPTVDSQIATLKASGADTFVNVTTPKPAAQAIRKAYDIGWKPKQYLSNVAASVGSVLTPAGLEKAVGLNTVGYFKDPTDTQWEDDPAMKEWKAFMKEYLPEASLSDGNNLYGYLAAETLVQVLEQCGDDLTRANIMKQATNLKGFAPGLLLPGIKIDTGPHDFFPFDQLALVRFNGTTWVPVGDALVAK